MDLLREANAVVHFRLLRSLGQFRATLNPRVFSYQPCLCGRGPIEPLPNGLPETVKDLHFKEIIEEYSGELGRLCVAHYGESRRPAR